MRTDSQGRIRVRGFYGDYRACLGDGEASFAVSSDTTEATVRLSA
jgi:hypothetical protein